MLVSTCIFLLTLPVGRLTYASCWLFASFTKKGLDYFVKVLCFESVIITKKWRNFDKNSLKELKQIEVKKKWKNCQILFEKTSKKHVFQTFKPKPFLVGKLMRLERFAKPFWIRIGRFFHQNLQSDTYQSDINISLVLLGHCVKPLKVNLCHKEVALSFWFQLKSKKRLNLRKLSFVLWVWM